VGPKGSHYYKDGRIVEERTDGFLWMKFLYKKPFGLVPRLLFRTKIAAKLAGLWANSSLSKRAIKSFIKRHNIDMNEFERSANQFTSFNDFFVRKFKHGARIFESDAKILSSPCEGKVIALANLDEKICFFIKGKRLKLAHLFKDSSKTRPYKNGTMLIFRLAPYDYHRFHLPFTCELGSWKRISGTLESVNPFVYHAGIQPLLSNERIMLPLTADHFGRSTMFIIGAMFVGSIIMTQTKQKLVKRGEELGYFAFGGSSLIMLFPAGAIHVRDDIIEHSKQGYETAVILGESIARAT